MRKKTKSTATETDIERLPSLPQVLLHLLDIIQDEGVSFEHITDIIRCDPALTIKVMAASPEPLSRANPLEKAVARIGLDTIRSIIAASAVWQFFSRNSEERTGFLKAHWFHSLLCAHIAEGLAQEIEYAASDQAWLAGLLHDAGQLLLEINHPAQYSAAIAQLSEDEYFPDLEQEEFGITHQQVGYRLLKKYHAPVMVCDAVQHHHAEPELLRDAHLLVRITYLANRLGNAHFNDNRESALAVAGDLFELERRQVEDILERAREATDAAAARFEVELDNHDADSETVQKITANDQMKQVMLAEQVRNIALLNGIHQHLSHINNHDELIEAICRNIAIILGYDNCLIFLYDAATDSVCAQSAGDALADQNLIGDLCIPLEPGRSLLTDALLDKHAITTFESAANPLNIVDRQIIDLCGGDGVLCQPLIVNNAAIGVLAIGIRESSRPRIDKQKSLLRRFAAETASTINALHRRQAPAEKSGPEDTGKLLQNRAREVIHEARNPLSIINNYLEILGYKLKDDDPAQQDLSTIREEISRISTILEKLSEPVKTDTRARTLIDVNALIADLSHMFQTSLFAARSISISLDLDDTMPPVLSNADALKQIYTNLVKNSVEALPAEGQVMVYTQDNVNVDGQPHFELCVADDGPGIPEGILPRLFTPVETTKGGGHAGLGLTIVKNLVSDLQGSISCRSSDRGTSFHILLPRKLDNG